LKKRLRGNLPYEEQRLLQKLAEGDEAAFFTIYQSYSGKIYRMALDYLHSAFMAKDIVQESFTKLWQHRGTIVEIRNLDAWLTTVTKNLLINQLRKNIPDTLSEKDIADNTTNYIDYRELEMLVQKAVEHLPPQQKKVYELSRSSGLPHKEIAASLGISYDMTREHLSKALKNIRLFLEKHYGSLTLVSVLMC
jgi:RNA polymerase sigma-70 factor (family 1)